MLHGYFISHWLFHLFSKFNTIALIFVFTFYKECMDGWMFSGWSSTPASRPQDGPNVHHGLSIDVTITYFCIRPGFTDETMSVLHVFG
jgi:hypothetical protein